MIILAVVAIWLGLGLVAALVLGAAIRRADEQAHHPQPTTADTNDHTQENNR